jgi:hypothetical protein
MGFIAAPFGHFSSSQKLTDTFFFHFFAFSSVLPFQAAIKVNL